MARSTDGRRRLAWIMGVVSLALLPVVAAGVALRVQYTGQPSPSARSTGHDALWMGHAWVDGRRGPKDMAALGRLVNGSGIRDVYVHVGPLADDGSLDPALRPAARTFLQRFRTAIPGVRVSAWLGNVVGADRLNLERLATRQRVASSALAVLGDGFDGVHYDLEPIRDGDAGFLDLLDRTAAAIAPRGAVLSVSADQVEPLPGMAEAARAFTGRPQFWSVRYLRMVAGHVNQIAIMSYDTALPVGSLYGGFVARQTRLALAAVGDDAELLMGVPAFHTDDLGHHESAETVAAAVRGVRLAVSGHPRRAPFGVALYVDFAATPEDWRAYHRDWVDPRS
ncbi:MAG: hypothetical protein ACRDYX_05405 [Egibacteraceae bacterium]